MVPAELLRQFTGFRFAPGLRGPGGEGFVGLLAERSGGALRDGAARFGGEPADFVLRCDEQPQLGRNLLVLGEKRFGVERFLPVGAVEVVLERRLKPRIVRFRLGWFVHDSASAMQEP